MVRVLERVRVDYRVACHTNNISFGRGPSMTLDRGVAREIKDVMALFHFVLESRKAGVRKPDPRFYRIACDALSVEPAHVVYLDDLGINLKPARQMGMRTIKVQDPDLAVAELEQILGRTLR